MTSRDVEQDPRVGDLVRVVPLGGQFVETTPLRIVEVDDRWVHWERNGERLRTPLPFWRGERIATTRRIRLELVEVSA